jgi:hypothetical protein
MQNLFPIIRRVRRPLIATDAPPVAVGKSVPDGPPSPVQPVAAKPVESVVSEDEPQIDDAQVTPNRSER